MQFISNILNYTSTNKKPVDKYHLDYDITSNNELDNDITPKNKLDNDITLNNELDLNELEENKRSFIFKKFLNNPYYETNDYKSFIVDKSFLNYTKKWSLNRNINKTHWKKLYSKFEDNIKNKNQLDLTGIITICFYENNFLIIDGQHRIKAIKELMNTYNFDCNIRIDIFYPENYEIMVKLIKKINYILPIDINKIFENNIHDIIKFIKEKYTNKDKSIVKLKSYQRPYINENKLVDELRKCKYLNLFHNKKKLFKMISSKNNEYKKKNINELKFDNKSVSLQTINIADEFDCYLGLDNNYKWLLDIENNLQQKFQYIE